MMIRGFFTTFLMKQSLGRFGFGNAAFGSGLLVILFMVVNLDLSKQSYTFSMTCFHIYPGWYQLIISKIIRTFATGGLMPDFYC